MNREGFSLIELLGVISVLAVLSLIIAVPVTDSIKKSNIEACKSQLKTIIKASELWGKENIYSLPAEINEEKTITISQLKTDGFLENDLKNPINKQEFPDSIEIKITKTGKLNWEYSFKEDLNKKYCK